jgi:hypothetical protein
MLKIRRLLPGEERVYNEASWHSGDGKLSTKDGGRWVATILRDGQTIVEAVRPCVVRFKDGGRTTLIEALEEIAHDTDNVRHARVVARRALREVEE